MGLIGFGARNNFCSGCGASTDDGCSCCYEPFPDTAQTKLAAAPAVVPPRRVVVSEAFARILALMDEQFGGS